MDESEAGSQATKAQTPGLAGEQVFFSEQGIQITSARAIFPGTTYAMANITSVSEAFAPPKRFWPIVTVIVGVFLLAAHPAAGILVVAAGVFWWFKQKKVYYLRIGSASGEAQPLWSTNYEWIHRVVQAMNEAFIKRG